MPSSLLVFSLAIFSRNILRTVLRLFKAHANGRNIVGPNMLRPFAWSHNNVGTCWYLLRIVWNRSNFWAHANGHNIVGQQHATLLGPTCSVRLHGTTTMLAIVAYSLKPVKLLGPYKRTQHCWPTKRIIVGPNMLRPFAWSHNNVGPKTPTTRNNVVFAWAFTIANLLCFL